MKGEEARELFIKKELSPSPTWQANPHNTLENFILSRLFPWVVKTINLLNACWWNWVWEKQYPNITVFWISSRKYRVNPEKYPIITKELYNKHQDYVKFCCLEIYHHYDSNKDTALCSWDETCLRSLLLEKLEIIQI